MKLAEKFHVPVITFIDTPGAWAGLGAEERGQSEAIAHNLFEMSRLEVPIIATVIGEGGSGGALALGVADRVLMLENSVYSVITIEGCAAILWKDGKSPEMRERAAGALKITAPDLYELRVIDEIIPEPLGGAHSNHEQTATAVQEALNKHLEELRRLKPDKLDTPAAREVPANGTISGVGTGGLGTGDSDQDLSTGEEASCGANGLPGRVPSPRVPVPSPRV